MTATVPPATCDSNGKYNNNKYRTLINKKKKNKTTSTQRVEIVEDKNTQVSSINSPRSSNCINSSTLHDRPPRKMSIVAFLFLSLPHNAKKVATNNSSQKEKRRKKKEKKKKTGLKNKQKTKKKLRY